MDVDEIIPIYIEGYKGNNCRESKGRWEETCPGKVAGEGALRGGSGDEEEPAGEGGKRFSGEVGPSCGHLGPQEGLAGLHEQNHTVESVRGHIASHLWAPFRLILNNVIRVLHMACWLSPLFFWKRVGHS